MGPPQKYVQRKAGEVMVMKPLATYNITTVTVAVDYPLVRDTTRYNRHHFDRHILITTPDDVDSHEAADAYGGEVFETEVFYDKGAYFNKYAAVEECFNSIGRSGWILCLDADIYIPTGAEADLHRNTLHTPHRRMGTTLLPEDHWQRHVRDPYMEFSGYFHLFHADDMATPWFETDWVHAGGADTMFQNRWPNKIRPHFDVLHVGPGRTNWCGVGNKQILDGLMEQRNILRNFKGEKL
jgi:hypothetical protein